jgi:hypothetical protein
VDDFGWHPGAVGVILRIAEFWWLILPLAGMIVAAIKALSASNQRDTSGRQIDSGNEAARRREIARLLDQHDRTNARWMAYELDIAKLLDFPMMTDMRNPLTMGFHKAKLRAELLRPVKVDDLIDDREARLEYRDAVHDYITAFDVAEAEAIRKRRSDFSSEGQERLARAQSLLRLASDPAATPQERQHAYDRASAELDGLIVLPATTRAAIERGIAGQIES